MQKLFKRKLFAGILSACMIFQTVGVVPVYAVENGANSGVPSGTSSVCTHHISHDEACQYKEEEPCTHTHTADCYTDELICGFSAEEVDSGTDSNATHTHTQECCKLNCPHENGEHDGTCGYTEGTPCNFDPAACEICNPKENETVGDSTADNTQSAVEQLISMIDALPNKDEITYENREAVKADFETVLAEYEKIFNDKTTIDLDGQLGAERLQKLTALREALSEAVNLVVGEEEEVYAVYDGTKFYKAASAAPTTATETEITNNKTINHLYIDVETVPKTLMYLCTNLKTVICSDRVKTIADGNSSNNTGAFYDCIALKSIKMPNVTTIGKLAFSCCTALTEVTMPEVTTIGEQGFYCCAFTNVTTPKVTTIGESAFLGSNLTEVTMLEVTTIGPWAFNSSTSLESITMPKVTEIGERSFGGCTDLTEVTMPEITKIGLGGFGGCAALAEVTMPKVTEIGEWAFGGCAALTKVTMPEAIEIGHGAFVDCEVLEEVTMPKAIKIGEQVFDGCTVLTEVTMPKVTEIGQRAFANCTALTKVTMPEVTKIGKQAFMDRIALTEVTIPKAIEIGEEAFSGCTALTKVTMLEVTKIKKAAFARCEALTKATMPKVTEIGEQAFFNCKVLTEVTMLEVTIIGSFTFWSCALTTVTMPKVKEIGRKAFNDCTILNTVIFKGATPPTIEDDTFNNCTALEKIYVPNGSLGAYKAARNLKDFAGKMVGYKLETELTGGVKTDKTEYAYGDTITVTVTPTVTDTIVPQTFFFTEPTAQQMALFVGETQITESQAAESGTELIFTIDTTKKAIPASLFTGTEQMITAKYIGNDNVTNAEGSVKVKLNKKPISATVNQSKVFDGNVNFTNAALTLADIESGDTVTATADGTVQDANVGTSHAFTATSTALGGTHKDYYSLANDKVTGNVAITAKPLTDAMISGIAANYDYTGKAIEPTPTVTDGTPSIIAASDYTVSYGANKEVSTGGTVTITAASGGNYSGTASKSFTIGKANSTAGLTVDKSDKTYTYGDTITFTVNVGLPNAKLFARAAAINTVDFYLGTDTTETGTKLNSSAITLTEADGTGTAAFAYDTTKNAAIPFMDNITVTAVYGGSDNLNSQTASVSGIKLQEKAISGTVTISVTNGTSADKKTDKGDTLTANVTAIEPSNAQIGLTYQWYRGTDKIEGETNKSYIVADADTAKTLSVKVTASGNYCGVIASTEVEVGKELILGSISITGTTAVGDILTLDKTNLTPEGAKFTTKWQCDGVDITGATEETYQLTKADLGKTITVVITGTDTFTGSMTAAKEIPPIKPEKPVITATAGNKEVALTWTAPFDGGSAITGYQLTVTPSITGSPFTIAGSATSYTVTGLTNVTEYEFTLKAINAKGDSEVSDVVSATPNVEYTVTFQTNGGSTVAEQQVTAGNKVIKPANPTKSNNRFYGWYKDSAFTTVWNFDTDTVQSDTTIYAKWIYNGSSGGGSTGGGSSGGSSGGSTTTTTPDVNKPTSPTTTTTTVKPTVDKNGNANISITDKTVDDAIKKAQDEAKKNGTVANGIAVEINAVTNKTVNNLTASLPKSVQDKLIAAGVKNVTIKSGAVDIAINLEALKQIKSTTNSDVNVTATKVDNSKLSAEAKKSVGNRPIFDFKVTGTNGKTVSDFGKGSISISIPYTLAKGEKAENVVAVYIDDAGKVEYLTSSSYNANTGKLLFATNSFSTFGVAYKADTTATTFSDITNHWAKESIEFVTARGLFAGTGNGKFSPNASMTRGMFVTVIGRLAGANVSTYKQSSFTDVKADSYYMGYVEWANKNGIVKGTSTTTFAPDQSITREQMAVIIANYAKAIGFDMPTVYAAVTFADDAKISSYANGSVKQMQMAGILMGKDSNRFDPQGTATRAEVSAMLKRFVELDVSSDTADGWH